jgi:hypothetical protein|nr:MAG TPA: NinB protein [Caudoviricetes sp.]
MEITKLNAFAVLGQAVSQLEDGKTYTVEIKEKKQKRSREANAYAWALLDKLAAKLHTPKEDIYRDVIKNIGGNNETVCVQNKAVERLCEGWKRNGIGWVFDTFESKIEGCTNVILYYGSSTYDSAQMHRLIDLIVQECKQQNIETLTPEELARLKYE